MSTTWVVLPASGWVFLSACLVGAQKYPFHLERLPEGYPKPQHLFYQQKLDHFNPADHRRWAQRYLLGNGSWDGRGHLANGCIGPILLYTGNEGPITAFWEISGFIVQDLAQKLGGLLLFPEQRYYGASLPFGNASFQATTLRYLTTAQVLEDVVEVIGHVKATVPGAAGCPVVAFGGSYGGTLTALLRASHPATVIGGLAASSELGYYDKAAWTAHGVDEFSFEDAVVATWASARPGCLGAIHEALHAIDMASEPEMAKAFRVCEPRALGPGPKSGLFAYVLEGMPQGDYPSLGFPVTRACDALLKAQRSSSSAAVRSSRLIGAAAGIARSFFGSAENGCVPYNVGGPGNTPGDGPGPSPWGYQSCTETLHAFSARTFRDYSFNLTGSAALCNRLYNSTVRPDLTALAHEFGGGYALAEGTAGVSHLIWSHGTLDPWHAWFRNISTAPPQLNVHHIVMEGSAHHTDLRSPCSDDPMSVVRARVLEERIIRSWIQEAAGGGVSVEGALLV